MQRYPIGDKGSTEDRWRNMIVYRLAEMSENGVVRLSFLSMAIRFSLCTSHLHDSGTEGLGGVTVLPSSRLGPSLEEVLLLLDA